MKNIKNTLRFSAPACTNFLIAIAGTFILLTSQMAMAQEEDRWSVELRPGFNMATKDFGNADIGAGFGIEGTLAYRFMPHLALYGGWGWNQFSADRSFAGPDVNFEETGYTFGLQFIHPFIDNVNYLLRAGAVSNHIEIENDEGDVVADSGHGFGFQVEAGLTFSIGESWRIIPGIRYHALSRDIKIGDNVVAADLNYISVGIGVSKIF